LKLAADVSLLIRCRAHFVGTAEHPITIQRADPDKPWGVIALQGPGASGSRFEHVKFLGGGGALLDEVEYTGMVCVHNASKVVFDHCEFAGNSRCDDSLHVDRGEADVTNCWFHDGNSDSIDFDMSVGLIAHNKIEKSANDGLDLMTCWPRIVDNDISNCGDKGISVGEDSTPLVFNNRISSCTRGIEVKDRSRPLILDTSVTRCGRGVYAHVKNWRYGSAGWPVLVRSLVAKNTSDYVGENNARRTIAGTLIGQPDPNAGDAPAPEIGDVEWVLREYGIETSGASLGPVKEWKLVEPVKPLVAGTFEEDFVDPTDGWRWDAGVPRLAKREGDLVASFARDRGQFGRAFDWDFTDASREYVLVLEVAGEGVNNVTATAVSEGGDVSTPVEIDFEPSTYRFTTLRLPPRRYSGLLLAAEPNAARSHLFLHGYRVVAWPKGK
jgi:parallel beta-helix repeat protein